MLAEMRISFQPEHSHCLQAQNLKDQLWDCLDYVLDNVFPQMENITLFENYRNDLIILVGPLGLEPRTNGL